MKYIHDPIHRLALRNSLRNWRYSASAVLAVAIGLLSLWMFRGYMLCVAEMYQDHFQARNMLGDVIIESGRAEARDDWSGALNHEEQTQVEDYLRRDGETETLVRFLNVEGQISIGTETSIFVGLAYDRDPGEILRGKKWSWNAVAGHPLKAGREIIPGKQLSKLLGCELTSSDYLQRLGSGPAYVADERPFHCNGQGMLNITSEKGQVNAGYYSIAGIMDAGFHDLDRTWLMLDLKDAQILFDTDKVSWYSVRLKNGSKITDFVEAFNRNPELRNMNLKAVSWNEHRFSDLYRRTMSLLGVFEIFVTLILSGIVCITVFNLLVKIIQERMKEIGLLRSLGYRPGQIQRMFFEESLLAVGLGIILGTVSTMLVTWLVNRFGIPYKAGILSEPVPFAVSLSFPLWFSSFLTLTLLALFATFLASYRAAQKTVIQCLVQS